MQNISLGLNVKALYDNRDLYIKINFIRRTKNADLSVLIPDSVEFDSDAVSIDVIGRGEHRLTDLENQYPGNFAAGCERIVGKGSIEKTSSATLLKAQGLDLRAKNGDDIIIKIKNPVVKDKNVNIKAEATVLTLKENREIEAEAYLETVEPKCGFEKVNLVKLYNLKSGDNITKALQYEIDRLNLLGSGEIHVSEGEYNISSIILKSNVHLYFNKVILKVLPECNNEEKNYYTDETYFPEIDADPADFIELPENYVNWQDNGHAFFENALFFAERCENIKVLGSLTILGMGNITRENEFPSRPEGMHASKTFSVKLCKDVEIGGFSVNKDLWYEETLESGDDEPFYLNDDGTKSDIGIENMMKVTDGGHFLSLQRVLISSIFTTFTQQTALRYVILWI